MERVELEAAVARALYDDRVWDDTREVPWDEADDFQHTFFLEQAAVAVRVVLAEAERSVEAIPGQGWADAAGAGEDMW